MKIGVPREIKAQEYRVAIWWSVVYLLTRLGHEVYVEDNAGAGCGYPDEEYKRAGAILLSDHEAVFQEADLVVKVKEPLASETPLLRRGQILFTYLHLAAAKS